MFSKGINKAEHEYVNNSPTPLFLFSAVLNAVAACYPKPTKATVLNFQFGPQFVHIVKTTEA